MMEQDDCQKEVENLEKEATYTIISMDDEHIDKRQKQILNDAKTEITKLYDDFRVWLSENLNSEETSERFHRLQQETQNLLARTKIHLKNFSDREDVQAGKEKVVEVSNKVVEKVQDGIQEVIKNEHVSKVVDCVSDTFDSVVQDERVKENVKKLKKGTMKVAESAFQGLKRILDTDDEQDN